MSVTDAIILAAGTGTRLRGVVDDRPKGLIEFGGVALVGRSIALLRAAGIDRVTIVAGYRADLYHAFAGRLPHGGARVLPNDAFETTGSMASLAIALDALRDRDVLILESDIVYEARALTALLAGADADATLLSGPTGAGDEVWVSAPDGRLGAMSKTRGSLARVDGELVGITRLTAAGASAMRAAFDRFVVREGHGRMDYETGAMAAIAATYPIAAPLIADLCWGEIDDERHYRRVAEQVWPAVTAE